MPAADKGNSYARQQKQRKRVVKKPAPKAQRKVAPQAAYYVSQGKAVEKVANRQKKVQRKRRVAAPAQEHVSQGQAVEKRANVLAGQTRRAQRATGHPVVGKAIKRELEGKGLLAAGLKKVGETAGYVSTGGGPNVSAAVGRKATTGDFKPRGSAAITIPQIVSAKKAKGFGRAAQDLVNFPAVALPSVYVPLAGAVEAAHGRPQRIKQFGKDISQHDPVFNTGKAVVQAATGDTKGAAKSLKRAGKAASEHPGFAALEVLGAKGTLGRGAGRVARTGVAGKAIKKAASTDRAPRTEPGTNLSDKRTYSPDVIAKAGQVVKEKVQTGRAKRLRAKAETAKSADAHVLQRRANRIDPTRMKPADVRRRVDERVAANEDVRRINRAEVTKAVDKQVGKKGGAALSLVAQNITKASKEDLKAYREEIASHFDELDNAGKRANKQLRHQIGRVLRDPRVKMDEVQAATERYQEIVAPLQKKLTDRGLLAEGQADKAKLIPYAVRHMGAKHDPEKGLVSTRNVSRASGRRTTGAVPRTTEKAVEAPARSRSSAAPEPGRVGPYEVPPPKGGLPKGVKAERRRMVAEMTASSDRRRVGDQAARAKHAANGPNASARAMAEAVVNGALRKVPGAVTREEVPLKPQVIRAHMKKNKVKEPAFLTQAPNSRGARNYYVASDRAPVIRKQARTGEATRKGTFDANPETLRESAAKAQGLADATDGFAGFVKEVGHHDAKGLRTFTNRDLAQKAADAMQSDEGGNPTGATKFRPIRLNPWGANKEQLTRLLDEVNADSPTAAQAVAETITSAVEKNASGDGPWALVPDAAADQLAKHMKVVGPGAIGKTAELVNSSFRKTVLSTSPKWLLGNVTEAAGRSALAKAGPRSYVTGRKVMRRLKAIDPEAAKEASARAAGGGHYSMAQRQPRRDHTQFEDTNLEGLAKKLGAVWQSPGPKQAAGLWHAWTDLVFNKVNKPLESQFQTAMLGKVIRDSNLMDGNLRKLSKTAIDQAAHGLRETNEQVAFGRAVDRMYGKYNKFSPGGRQAIALYTPFVAWSLNAVKFVYDVLPRDHPTVTGLIATSEIATDEWRKSHGLDLFMKKAAPGFIQGSIPLKGGGHQQVSKLLPFGAFSAPTETAAGAVLPQLSGSLAALLRGEDWKGSKLKWHDGTLVGGDPLKRAAYAAQVFSEATVPAIGVGKRLIQQGPSTLNPIKPIAPKKAKVRRSSSSSGVTWDDSGSGVKWDDQGSGVKWGG